MRLPAPARHGCLANGTKHPLPLGAQAKAAMTVFNTLIDRVAADEAYLAATLANAAQQDEFTARLLALMQGSGPRCV